MIVIQSRHQGQQKEPPLQDSKHHTAVETSVELLRQRYTTIRVVCGLSFNFTRGANASQVHVNQLDRHEAREIKLCDLWRDDGCVFCLFLFIAVFYRQYCHTVLGHVIRCVVTFVSRYCRGFGELLHIKRSLHQFVCLAVMTPKSVSYSRFYGCWMVRIQHSLLRLMAFNITKYCTYLGIVDQMPFSKGCVSGQISRLGIYRGIARCTTTPH